MLKIISKGGSVMSKVCQYSGKGPLTGNHVSHSHRKTKRRWLPNLQTVRIDTGDGETIKVRVCARYVRAVKKLAAKA